MGVHSFIIRSAAFLALAARSTSGLNIIQSNDDGWAEMYLRTFHSALIDAGYDALVSAPADNESARSSLDVDPAPRTTACEYASCAAPAGAYGTNTSSDARLNWVNSYPATSMRYGIDVFAPAVWGNGTAPDLALTGPNVGSNIGLVQVDFSGTVGAACYAVDQGIPAVAFSGITEDRVAWDTTPVPLASAVYADLALNLTGVLVAAAGGEAYLPDGVFLNVNMAGVDVDSCAAASDFAFVLSRINIPTLLSTTDVVTCGDTWLPWEKDVVDAGCNVAVSVGTCSDKTDADGASQQVVLDRLSSILTCL